jgi:hypothetical protein
MTRHDQRPNSPIGQSQTPERFRVSLDGLGYDDFTRKHPAGIIRFISYEKGSDLEEQTRKKLAERGLILGTEIPSYAEDEMVNYRVPTSSRPISYDVGSNGHTKTHQSHQETESSLKYTDRQLFNDAAELLGVLATVRTESQIGYVHRIGQLLITTEFDDPGERKLFLAPGIERVLRATDNGLDTIAVNYRERFEQEFGERFSPSSSQFEERFVDIARN